MPSPIVRYVLIVDDEEILCALLKSTLESNGFAVEIAHNASEARDLLSEVEFDVALIDLDLGPGPSGVDLAQYMAENHDEVARLVLTRYPDLVSAGFAAHDLPRGTGLLAKDQVSDIEVLLRSIDDALGFSGVVVESDPKPPFDNMTRNQFLVLRMLAQGYSVGEIANLRGKSRSSVEKLVTTIYTQLGLDNDSVVHARSEAVRLYAQQFGVPNRP